MECLHNQYFIITVFVKFEPFSIKEKPVNYELNLNWLSLKQFHSEYATLLTADRQKEE